MIVREMKNLYIDLMEEVCTLEVINDANLGGTSDKGHIDAALNGCVKRLRKLMERADTLELKSLTEVSA
ncbi:MAG: hypothetical protein IJ955_09135 [Oscillospiraceae bacterium]|nr:hypothetical protein [Oscillospiraceae bacterium]